MLATIATHRCSSMVETKLLAKSPQHKSPKVETDPSFSRFRGDILLLIQCGQVVPMSVLVHNPKTDKVGLDVIHEKTRHSHHV